MQRRPHLQEPEVLMLLDVDDPIRMPPDDPTIERHLPLLPPREGVAAPAERPLPRGVIGEGVDQWGV